MTTCCRDVRGDCTPRRKSAIFAHLYPSEMFFCLGRVASVTLIGLFEESGLA